MPLSSVAIKVDGRWMDEVAPWSPPRWTSLADGGCGEASWRLYAPPTFRHPALRRGKLVQIKVGAANVYSGVLAEPTYDQDGWQIAASGLSTLSGDGEAGYAALDGASANSSTPDVAIDAAIVRGLPWTRPNSLSNVAFIDAGAMDDTIYLGDLLDRWSDSASKRWGVDPDGVVYAAADPTTPMWHMTPGSGTFGLADDDYASDIYLRYYNTSFALATAHAGDTTASGQYGRKEFIVDGRDYGAIAGAKATAYAQGFLDKGKARLGWTNTVEPSRYQLTTSGGTPVSPALVRAQQMVRLHGLTNEQGQPLPYVDFVIGVADYDSAEDHLSLAPVGMVQRSLSDVLTLAVS